MMSRPKRYLRAWLERPTLVRAVKVSALEGTLLLLINQGDLILSGTAPPPWKVLLTYFVPYAVSSWSSVAASRPSENDDRAAPPSSSPP